MRLPTLLLALAPLLLAEGPEFEVASIKPFEIATPATAGAIRLNAAGGGPGTNDPTHMIVNAMSIKSILGMAFDMKNYQLLNADSSTDMYNFEVVLPASATKDDVKIMWRNLLISRFGLKYHMEQREFQVDELTVAPKGHKLIENKEPEPPPVEPGAPPVPVTFDKDGRPILARPGLMTTITTGPGGPMARMVGKAQPASALTTPLASQLGHPVVDKTGLTRQIRFLRGVFTNNHARTSCRNGHRRRGWSGEYTYSRHGRRAGRRSADGGAATARAAAGEGEGQIRRHRCRQN